MLSYPFQALSDAARVEGSDSGHDIFKSSVALLFFGVPNHGVDNPDIVSWIGRQNNSRLGHDLERGSALLRAIHQNVVQVFDNQCPCRMVSFYEALDTTKSNTINVNLTNPSQRQYAYYI
jgi:hypothetical protein